MKKARTTRTTQQPPLLPEEVKHIAPTDILGTFSTARRRKHGPRRRTFWLGIRWLANSAGRMYGLFCQLCMASRMWLFTPPAGRPAGWVYGHTSGRRNRLAECMASSITPQVTVIPQPNAKWLAECTAVYLAGRLGPPNVHLAEMHAEPKCMPRPCTVYSIGPLWHAIACK